MGFCKFIDKYELRKTHNAFLLYKLFVFELKPYFFLKATQKMPDDFTLVLCNKINEFLAQTKCPVQHVPYDILLVCISLQSPKRRS